MTMQIAVITIIIVTILLILAMQLRAKLQGEIRNTNHNANHKALFGQLRSINNNIENIKIEMEFDSATSAQSFAKEIEEYGYDNIGTKEGLVCFEIRKKTP